MTPPRIVLRKLAVGRSQAVRKAKFRNTRISCGLRPLVLSRRLQNFGSAEVLDAARRLKELSFRADLAVMAALTKLFHVFREGGMLLRCVARPLRNGPLAGATPRPWRVWRTVEPSSPSSRARGPGGGRKSPRQLNLGKRPLLHPNPRWHVAGRCR